jgi:hypothetical protein
MPPKRSTRDHDALVHNQQRLTFPPGVGSDLTLDPSAVFQRCQRELRESNASEAQAALAFHADAMRTVFGDSEDVEVQSKEISLVCPILKDRTRIPVRGRECRHVECFDLHGFFQAAEKLRSRRDPAMNCPFAECNLFVHASKLVVDWWLKSVLELYPAVRKVVLQPNGTVEPVLGRDREADIEVEGFSQIPTQRVRFPLPTAFGVEFGLVQVKRERGLGDSPSERQPRRDQPSPDSSHLDIPEADHQQPARTTSTQSAENNSPLSSTDTSHPALSSYTFNGISVDWNLTGTQGSEMAGNNTQLQHGGGGVTQQFSTQGSPGVHGPAPTVSATIGPPHCGQCGGRPISTSDVPGTLTCCGLTLDTQRWPHVCDVRNDHNVIKIRITQQVDECGENSTSVVLAASWRGTGLAVGYMNNLLTRNGMFTSIGPVMWHSTEILSRAEIHYVHGVCVEAVEWEARQSTAPAGTTVEQNVRALKTNDWRNIPPRFTMRYGS